MLHKIPSKSLLILQIFLIFFCLVSATFIFQKSFKERTTEEFSRLNERDNFKLIEKYWYEEINKVGGEKAYMEFKNMYNMERPQVLHTFSHIFGLALFKSEGSFGIRVCDGEYGFGCYHGFATAFIGTKGLDALGDLNNQCISKNGEQDTGCRHGIGHGLLEFLGNSEIKKALDICANLQTSTQLGCTQGVFMEFNRPGVMNANQFLGIRKLENEAEIFYPCDSVDSKFQISCYYEQSQWWLGVYKDYKKVGQLCDSLTSPDIKRSCFLGVGVNAAQATAYSSEETTTACSLMPSIESQIDCRSAAGWVFKVNPNYSHLSFELCEGLSEAEKKRCLNNSVAPNGINLADN